MLSLGVEPDYFTIDVSIARGLDYYTGTVYETMLDDYPKIGSVCSGGRYDDLASHYTEEKLPGVGISIGLTRLFYQLKAIGVINCSRKTIADVIVVPMDECNIASALRVSQMLRAEGHKVDVLLEEMPIKKKFRYVSQKDAGFTVVIGSDEEESGLMKVQHKHKENGQIVKESVLLEELPKYITNNA
jgi:histidyl-tRNA synthetase